MAFLMQLYCSSIAPLSHFYRTNVRLLFTGTVAMACTRGIVKEHKPSLLKVQEHGGSIDLVSQDGNGRSSSNSLLEMAGMVKRKATTVRQLRSCQATVVRRSTSSYTWPK